MNSRTVESIILTVIFTVLTYAAWYCHARTVDTWKEICEGDLTRVCVD